MSSRGPFEFADRVRFADLDARGHLNNVAFLAIVEAARNAFLRHVDPAYDPTAPGPRDLILVRTEIDYEGQAAWEEELAVQIAPEDVTPDRLVLRFGVRAGERRLASGRTVQLGFDYEGQRPAGLPEAILAGLRA
jgi:acyl-CoA thioester hydrolase